MNTPLQTRIVTVDPVAPDPALIEEAAAILVAGRLVAFPTETVYGLGANALDADAVQRIFAAKGRPASDPLIVHIYSLTQLEQITQTIPDIAWELAHHFWPGPLTLVLPKGEAIPANVSAGLATVAVRMPNHTVPYLLLKCADRPIAAPSANRFARPSPTQAQHVYDDLAGQVELILDAGPTTIGLESTVLDLTQPVPTILRPGGLPLEALRPIVPNVTYSPRYANSEDAATPAPGMLLKHYSPNVALLLFDGAPAVARAALRERAQQLMGAGKQVGVLVEDEEVPAFATTNAVVAKLGAGDDVVQIAAHLFAGMRSLERAGVDVILTRTFGRAGLGLAVCDRLVRATEGKIITV
ncbi:MAG TPA: L-threonylcarbamoyladenylate synthase, partial [Caldilineaceae bacterium]|nr:L-threonylcarbamoyladenylate synthase [Caldilineaceae bacterium]